MKRYESVVAHLRPVLQGVGVMVVVLTVALGATVWAVARMKDNELQQQTLLQAEQVRHDQLAEDLANVAQHILRYKVLQEQGLIGDALRTQWLEGLAISAKEVGVFHGFKATLDAPTLLVSSNTATNEETKSYVFDMNFELAPVVETDVLDLLNRYRDVAKGRFRLQQCTWQEPKEQGFLARCKLRFFALVVDTPEVQ